jgi:predicted nucleic acid-binding protein
VSTYLLDTSVLIDALRGVRGRAEGLARLVEDGHLLACSVITVAEVYAGMRPRERAATENLLESLETYDVTRQIAERAGLLRRTWAARGKTIALIDLLIASTALESGLILVTDNIRDFPMKELQLHASPVGR